MHPSQPSNKKKKQTNPNPSPAPPPYYITSVTPPAYCHTCGRIISSKRNTPSAKKQQDPPKTTPKFCSERCKRHKPSLSPASVEVHVEKALVALLEGRAPPPPYKSSELQSSETEGSQPMPFAVSATKKKGESRVLLPLSILEEAVFGSRSDPERSYGRRRNRAFRGVREDGQWRSVDMEDDSEGESGARPEPISTWDEAEDFDGDDVEIEGGVKLERRNWDDEDEEGGAGEMETPELAAKRRAGQKKAEEREFIRCVVRRAVVFGIEVEGWEDIGGSGTTKKSKKGKGRNVDDDEDVTESEVKPRRKCEAIMSGQIVEPSFAKGDWSVRWRDE